MQLARWALLPLWAAVGLMPWRRAGGDPLTRGLFAGPVFVVISGPETVPETTGGGCNLFCGEVHRLPLDLRRSPGGAAAIVWRWVRVVWIVAGACAVLSPMSARRVVGGGRACTGGALCVGLAGGVTVVVVRFEINPCAALLGGHRIGFAGFDVVSRAENRGGAV